MTERFNPLTPEEERIILRKGTEPPFTGKFHDHWVKGFYVCRRCNAGLYRSNEKFRSDCGWPSFDAEIAGAVKRLPDADGRRTEILCARCGGHLGHVFLGEGYTAKNTRHCVNSVSLDFVPAEHVGRAIFAGGCFWGVEYHFQTADGALAVRSGYTGGTTKNPTYKEVCGGGTGHVEAVEVYYDVRRTTYEAMAKIFFEIHDPTQADGQGPDIGVQYLSVIFAVDDEQKKVAEKLIGILSSQGLKIATRIVPAAEFHPAEDYHQNHYRSRDEEPYCHVRTKRF